MFGMVQTNTCAFWYELGRRKKMGVPGSRDPNAIDGNCVAFLNIPSVSNSIKEKGLG